MQYIYIYYSIVAVSSGTEGSKANVVVLSAKDSTDFQRFLCLLTFWSNNLIYLYLFMLHSKRVVPFQDPCPNCHSRNYSRKTWAFRRPTRAGMTHPSFFEFQMSKIPNQRLTLLIGHNQKKKKNTVHTVVHSHHHYHVSTYSMPTPH